MTEPPVFFLPHAPTDQQEDIYEFMAAKNERNVPCMGKRVYAITFELESAIWAATVGEQLCVRKKQVQGGIMSERPVKDSALVLAIFPPDPYCVVADLASNSRFVSPFIVTSPTAIECFFWPRLK
jgi:hypothetical protein